MATNLTAIAPVLFSAAQEVSAEPTALINSINANFDDKGVSANDELTVPVVPLQELEDFSPGATNPVGVGGGVAEAIKVKIQEMKKVSHILTGEQIRSLENGNNYQEWTRQWAAMAMRQIRNRMELVLGQAIKEGASRAIGTAGTTPFASSLDDLADVRKILLDNGAPMVDLHFVGNSATESNLHKLNVIQQAYAAGSDAERRSGIVGRQMGFDIHVSAGLKKHVKGSVTSLQVNDAGSALEVGDRDIVLKSGNSGTLKLGDIITFAGADDKYISALASSALTAGTLKINRPGLREVPANSAAVTVGNDYSPNLAFERSAIVGVIRPPIMPDNPTIRGMLISDDRGLTYLFQELDQYGQRSWEIVLCYGFKVVQPEHVAILLG